jgi:hypothetical protein
MIDILRLLALDCALVVGGALALALVLRFASAALDAIPMSRARRAFVERVRPLAGVTLVAVFVVLAVRWVLESDDRRAWIAIGVVTAVVIAVSWRPLRDIFEGVFFRVGRVCGVGDRVQIGTLRGRVQCLTLRGIHIESVDGELAFVPYRLVTAQPLLRTTGDDLGFHVFRVHLPPNRTVADARRIILETALLSHWSSIARHPHVAAAESGDLEITVFAVDPDRAPELELALRQALETN